MTDAIRFLLNGEARVVEGLAPTTTVLEYLRGTERLCGTKEGCAEGDCGACTVVVAEPDRHGLLSYRAVNSCIRFLPTLDGKQLLTVEGLKTADGALHPVQQALVDCHASQCGYCTPGFVMSLLALRHNNPNPSREDTLQALAGNLCRCTGYRPILDAAKRMYDAGVGDAFTAQAADTVRGLEPYDRLVGLRYAAHGQEFIAPRSLDELTGVLKEYPQAHILAGGTDFGLFITKQHRRFERLIYLGEIPELRAVTESATHLEIGGGTTWSTTLPLIERHWPSFGELIRRFASPPIRNAATVGGNIANASPIGDGPPPLIALGASLVLLGPDGQREVPLETFFRDYRETDRRPGEIVARVRVPLPGAGSEFAVYKVSKRLDQDISAVCAAFAVRLQNGLVAKARLAFGGMAAIPKRARQAESAIIGRPWTAPTIEAAVTALARDFTPLDDMRASARYRTLTARNLLRRFHLETTGTANVRIAYG
jgi:xanthine dehydrogenase small subunit